MLRLAKPERTQETIEQYKAFPKPKQDELKDIGGYVGGVLRNGRRKNENAGERYIITLDADNIPPGETQTVVNAVDALGCAYAVYSTRKHENAAPKLRIIFPMDIPATPDEYEPIARKIASFLRMNIFDPTTFEPVRLMYWPSCSVNSEYVFVYADKPFLSKNGMLALYHDWRDVAEWPEVPGAAAIRNRSAKKQGNPLEKSGVVGAFCKSYDILEAVEHFLPGVYEVCNDGRLTYTEGSTIGGAVLYEGGNFLYSHHATDPASGRLCNSFDLVRLHMFGEEDEEAKPDTPVNNLPSFKAMCEFAIAQEPVAKLITTEKYEKAMADFSDVKGIKETDLDWMGKLRVSSQTGLPVKTIDNVLIILENDPKLKGCFYHDEFGNRPMVGKPLPWEQSSGIYKAHPWADEDDSGLRHYIEKVYSITGKERIYDAFSVCAMSHKKHNIRDYLNSLVWDDIPRLDTLLIDYLGAADTDYTRAVTRKTLTAAVARAMHPGTKFDSMLILSGAQGIGKSTLFRLLGREWYSDSLSTFEGKEASELIQGYWIIEAGELTGLNKSEMNAVKQFMSKTEDIYRVPYGRRTAAFPRGCIIVGTTNDTEFLKDRTGNRRFWPVDLGKYQIHKDIFSCLAAEVDQIWAEAVVRYRCGEKLFLEGGIAEEAVRQQEEHKERSPKEGAILEFLERKVPNDWNKRGLAERRDFWNFGAKGMDESKLTERTRICAAEIWCECFYGDLKMMKRSDALEINGILGSISGWEKASGALKFGTYYGAQKGYIRSNFREN